MQVADTEVHVTDTDLVQYTKVVSSIRSGDITYPPESKLESQVYLFAADGDQDSGCQFSDTLALAQGSSLNCFSWSAPAPAASAASVASAASSRSDLTALETPEPDSSEACCAGGFMVGSVVCRGGAG